MKKDELKSLVTQMYEDLIQNINSQTQANKEQVIDYLRDAVSTIEHINDEEMDSIEHARLAFTNTYKSIADKSISSYKETNGRFEELTQLHGETIIECHDALIDLPSIKAKFDEIQNHMNSEVQRANSVISKLTNQVKELEESSNLDALTKVFNRRALNTYLENICCKKELKHELHLMILDIDDFKKINDEFGHIAGDKILIFITNLLRKTLRDGDKIFRYGGEEFIIILNRIDTKTCTAIARRIINLISSNQLIYKSKSLNVTVSVGATKFHSGDTPDTLIARADKALYRSKQNGKNQMSTENKDGI
ncbi:GGDEF domain-containing protein [Sulfurimonas sp.]